MAAASLDVQPAGVAPSGSSQGPRPAADPMSSRVDVINTDAGRILCVADVRGNLSTLNTLAAEHSAVAIIHSGDFGFYEPSSLAGISDRTLKHLVQYSPLIPAQFRSQLLSPNTSPSQMRDLLANPPRSASSDDSSEAPGFGLSEFPRLLNGELRFNVPVYTVWGACEDVAILEKIRLAPPSPQSIPSDPSKVVPVPPSTATRPSSIPSTPQSYSIPNLTVLDEATTRVLLIGGVRLRLFGLGGAVVPHKLFDNGSGSATIAGGQGTMWTTMLQIGELVDTAQKVYDPSETRLLISHAAPGREGLLAQLALVLKADLTVSAGLHFRYGVSYNEFSVQHDPDAFRTKLEASRKAFNEIWDAVKAQVEGVVDENQRALLQNALAVANRVPANNFVGGAANVEEAAWKNCWNWNLPDAAFGSLVLDIRDGRIGSEMKSQGFNFAYRQNTPRPPPAASAQPQAASSANSNFAASTPAPPAVSRPAPPTGPAAAASAPNATPAAPQSLPFAQRPFAGQGQNGPAHPHSRQTPIGNHPHQQQQQHRGAGRGGGRGGFGAPGSAMSTPRPNNVVDASASQAAPAADKDGSVAVKDESANKAQGATPVNGDAIQTPAPHQPRSGRGQRGMTPHQRQQQQQQQQQAQAQAQASASGNETNASAPDATKKQDATPASSSAAADAAGNTTGAESSAAEGGPLSPSTPSGDGAGLRGGRGGRGRGRGSRGRSNGEWTRGSGRGGRGGNVSAGEGSSTPSGGADGKKSGGGGGEGSS